MKNGNCPPTISQFLKTEPDGITRRAFVHLNSDGPESDSLGA